MTAASDLAFGLTTAAGYGTGDFLARQASHRIGHLSVLFYMELIGMVILLPVAVWFESSRWEATTMWLWLVVLGSINLVASLFLYKSFEYGVLSVVSPLASSYPAVTATLAIVFLGDRPGGLASLGIVAVLSGIMWLSRSRVHPANPAAKDPRVGIVSAFVAFAGYGVFYFALKCPVVELGPVTSAAVSRLVGVMILLAVAVGGRSIGRPPRGLVSSLLAIGVVDSLAFLAYNVGIQGGSVAVVGTLSGLFSAVTVGLAVAILRERLTWPQYAGVAAIFVGVALLAIR